MTAIAGALTPPPVSELAGPPWARPPSRARCEGDGQQSALDPAMPLHSVPFVVIDVETTGGAPSMASLTEVAAARYRGGELAGTFRTFVRPDQRIPPFIAALTGITDAMVATAPSAGAVLPSLLEFIGTGVVVGHNVRFDLSFLDHALHSTGREALGNPAVDTLAMARRLVRDDFPNCQLGTLASHLRLEHQPAHRALDDVLATGDLLHALLERARGRVLFVEQAEDVRARARSHFLVKGDRRTNRLLRQMRTVGHRCCPDERSAAAMERALVERWNPMFNRATRARAGTGG
jgi:DNA polymerase-3 subunit epsilon